MRVLANSDHEIGDILEKAANADRAPDTKKHQFRMHLEGLVGSDATIPYLEAENQRLIDRIRPKFPK